MLHTHPIQHTSIAINKIRQLIIMMQLSKCSKFTIQGKPCPFYSRHEYDGACVCGIHHKTLKRNEPCTICLDDMAPYQKGDLKQVRLSCGHFFHTGCLAKCTTTLCPQCRKAMTPDEAINIFRKTKIDPIIGRIFSEIRSEEQNDVFNLVDKIITIAKDTSGLLNLDFLNTYIDSYRFGASVFDSACSIGGLEDNPSDMIMDLITLPNNAIEHFAIHGTYEGFRVIGHESMLVHQSYAPEPIEYQPPVPVEEPPLIYQNPQPVGYGAMVMDEDNRIIYSEWN
jgi:hypothetical protein